MAIDTWGRGRDEEGWMGIEKGERTATAMPLKLNPPACCLRTSDVHSGINLATPHSQRKVFHIEMDGCQRSKGGGKRRGGEEEQSAPGTDFAPT